MDLMLPAVAAAVLNIGLLGGVIAVYIRNLRLIKSYFTIGLVLVSSLFVVQNIVIILFWTKLFMAGPSIKSMVETAAPYLLVINVAQSVALSILLWITRK
jgi:multidrug efflux pump subunit AcrB